MNPKLTIEQRDEILEVFDKYCYMQNKLAPFFRYLHANTEESKDDVVHSPYCPDCGHPHPKHKAWCKHKEQPKQDGVYSDCGYPERE